MVESSHTLKINETLKLHNLEMAYTVLIYRHPEQVHLHIAISGYLCVFTTHTTLSNSLHKKQLHPLPYGRAGLHGSKIAPALQTLSLLYRIPQMTTLPCVYFIAQCLTVIISLNICLH